MEVGGPDVVRHVARRLTRRDGETPRRPFPELAVRRQRRDLAHRGKQARFLVERQGGHRGRQLVQQVRELVVAGENDVARAAPGRHLDDRRRVRRQLAGLRVEAELEDLVGAQVRHEDVPVGLVDDDAVGIEGGGDHLPRIGHFPVLADGVDADLVAAIGRPEQVAPGLVHADGREAVGERRLRELLQRARLAIDRIGDHRVGLCADGSIEVTLVRANAHRHHHLACLNAISRPQRAVVLHRVHPDVTVLGIRHIDISCGVRACCGQDERRQDEDFDQFTECGHKRLLSLDDKNSLWDELNIQKRE